MKLWKKISLLCGLVLVLTAGVCTAVLTTQARNRILNLTYQNAEQKQQALVRSFSNMLLYYHEEQDSAAATRSMAKYCFTQYADSEAVLMLSGETVYSALSFDPSEYLTLEGGTPQRCTGTADGRELLIVGSSERLPYSFANNPDGTGCTVYIVQDITPVYEQMRTLTFQFAAIARIEHQTRWLERLVQKLLKLITLEQAPELRTSSVPELLERVKESTADALTQRGVTLQMECHAERLDMDADLMQSVLVNLVDNAGKASQPGQTVSLTADAAGFTVRDHGCGIPREEIERITEPFYMVDRSRSKKQGGVGLGLALVKEIVRAHGGRLEIESAVDEGTTVRVLMK